MTPNELSNENMCEYLRALTGLRTAGQRCAKVCADLHAVRTAAPIEYAQLQSRSLITG